MQLCVQWSSPSIPSIYSCQDDDSHHLCGEAEMLVSRVVWTKSRESGIGLEGKCGNTYTKIR